MSSCPAYSFPPSPLRLQSPPPTAITACSSSAKASYALVDLTWARVHDSQNTHVFELLGYVLDSLCVQPDVALAGGSMSLVRVASRTAALAIAPQYLMSRGRCIQHAWPILYILPFRKLFPISPWLSDGKGWLWRRLAVTKTSKTKLASHRHRRRIVVNRVFKPCYRHTESVQGNIGVQLPIDFTISQSSVLR